MDCEIEKAPDCYNFPGIRDFWKKYKLLSAKRQQQHHRKNNFSSNYKINDDDNNANSHAIDEHTFKATHDKKESINHMNEVKKLGQNGNGMEDFNKSGSNNYGNNHNDYHNYSCFKTIILLSAPKKKQFPSKIAAASDLQDNSSKERVERVPSRSRSFETTPSLGRSSSINNNKTQQWMKTPSNSREPSIKRTSSTGSRTTSFNGRNNNNNNNNNNNGSFVNRSTSIGRSSMRNSSISRSGPIIMFSNSSGVLKPPAIEQQLECTLEELCFGCVKQIKVSRDVYTFTGQIIQEEELLTVNVKPGWKTGTKITFQGTTNNERPGEYPADVIFTITEKHHPLFRRNDDDLELEIEIPLVDAITGCTLTIPLLGKEKISMAIDDVIYPGYEKILQGQGMPNQKKPDYRGDLKVKFLVEFPKTLADEQRSEIMRILSDHN